MKNRDQTVTNCSDILGEMCDFYTRLYRSSNIKNANIKSYIEKIQFQNILNEKQKMELDEFPSQKECDQAIKMLKPNKSPGLDGLMGESIKLFKT